MLTDEQKIQVAAIVAEVRATPSDSKGWIPTHDGIKNRDGSIRDPYIRNNDAHGRIGPYMPWFTSKGEANAWCRRVDAVAVSCEYGAAIAIAKANGAELIVA